MNHMKQVFCPRIQGPSWSNSCKMKRVDGKIKCDYRCCTCGATDHAVIKGK